MKLVHEALSERVAQQALLLLERRDAFLDDPDDIETNHKLRVSIRTLRSLADFLSPWVKKSQAKRLQGDLKSVVKKTSRLRELDVLVTFAKELDPPAPALVEFCECEARNERAQVLDYISGSDAREKIDRAVGSLQNLEWVPSVKKTGLDPAIVRNRFDDIAASLAADLDASDDADYEFIHAIRKRAKQVRYVAEQFSEVIGEDAVDIAKQTKRSQDRLGAICDAKVNREIVGTYLLRSDLDDELALQIVRLIQPVNNNR
ncbi:MAG: CHAD domain-containing protein [Eggerthellaceae bacterium]|nr:CHAD domain-containing protein [Eggerthellaceae bacterium]